MGGLRGIELPSPGAPFELSLPPLWLPLPRAEPLPGALPLPRAAPLPGALPLPRSEPLPGALPLPRADPLPLPLERECGAPSSAARFIDALTTSPLVCEESPEKLVLFTAF